MFQVTLLNKKSNIEVDQCIDLLQNSFNKNLDYYYWKHDLGQENNIEEYTFCVFKDDLCVATTQVVINTMFIFGQSIRFGLLCDGATHKDYRRLGLFEKLLSHINDFCSKKDVAFVYSTGNEKSRKALQKLGFIDFFGSYKGSKKIRYSNSGIKLLNDILIAINRLKYKKYANIRELTIDQYAAFVNIINKSYGIGCVKNVNYLKWRLADPTGTYKIYGAHNSENIIKGILVTKKSSDELYLVDIQCQDTVLLNQLLQFSNSLGLNDKNITKINCIHNSFKYFKKMFLENKFTIKSEQSSSLLFPLKQGFKFSPVEIEEMHYMRIDKNE